VSIPHADLPTAPPPPPEPPQPPRARRWPVVLGVAVAIAVVIILVGSIVRLPYVIYSPGSATPVNDVVRISGTRTYRHQGDVLFLTVAVSRDRPNVWRWLAAELDDDSQVVGENDYLQGASRKTVQHENEIAMTDSQLAAKKVALEKLGYKVTASGTGARVDAVFKDSPAAGHLRTGDVITAIDGEPVRLRDEVGPIVRAQPVGSTFVFTVTRHGRTRSESIRTEAAPSGELRGKPFIGIVPSTEDLKLDFPLHVTIDPGSVTGPSAGLAFTLTLIDELSPGNLTGGKDVAVTGTMDLDGHVGEVGGVPQKTATAIGAGAKLFLVPTAEVEQARERAGSAMKVVGVRTIDDALRALREHGGAPVHPVAPEVAA
jgi:Lon-like protease